MSEPLYEVERYELEEGPSYRFSLDRREFFQVLGAGVLVVLLAEGLPAQESGGGRRPGFGGGGPQEIEAWLHVGEDGTVTAFTGKAEVGQNVRTSLSQCVAEELRVPLSAVRMQMADTQLTPYDAGTFGSRTTPDMAPRLRRMAAAAREALVDLAAAEWKTDRATLRAEGGKVVSPSGQSLSYGKLAQGRKLVRPTAEAPLAAPAEWTVLGKPAGKVNGRDFVTGRHQYTSDIRLPGMLYGRVLRPPAYGAALLSADLAAAQAMPGVAAVRDGDFVAVAAPTTWAAQQALAAIKAEWKPAPAQVSDKELFEQLKKSAGTGGGRGGGRGAGGRAGSIPEGLAAADVRLQQAYTVAYIAHAPLEPRAAAAQWEDGKLTCWTGTQRPFGVRSELASAFGIPEERVRVIVPDTGSGYGGKHTGEAALEAARLAKAAGKPVKLVWTREEEFTWAYFRPAGVIVVTAGAKKDGTLTAWEFHNYNSGGSALQTLYEVPNRVTEFHGSQSPLRQGSYRGLAATANHFARESAMDELAHAAGRDPLAFRLQNLRDERLRAVLEAAAKALGWGRKLPAGHGAGLAGGSEKGSYVATCAEVTYDPRSGKIQVLRAVTAFECGAVQSPDHLRNQVEGALVQGLGGALTEAIEFADGRILNPRFSRYRVPRFSDTPNVEVVLVNRPDLPSAGAGETPIVAIAPAIANGVFAASGVRLRSLPLIRPRGT